MAKIEQYTVGQHFFQAELYRYDRDLDDGTGDAFTTREEAEEDGRVMVAAYDPEWQKRHPGAITYAVREWVCTSIWEDGSLGSARTV